MTDNAIVSGNKVATDEIGGAHYQRVKVTHGADGTSTDASAAAPFPVDQINPLAGERNPSSSTNSYMVTRDEVNITRVTTIASDVTVSATPAHLIGIIGEAASTTVVTLKDGAATVAALAAGAIPLAGGINFHAAKFDTSLVINIAATGGNVLVLWRPQ